MQGARANKKIKKSEMPASLGFEGIAKEKQDELDRYITLYTKEPGQLIAILQKAQDIFGYLPVEAQAYVAEKTGIPVSEVNGVVTFYSLFSTEPRGKHTLDLCMGTACYIKGAQELMDTLKEQLQIDAGETTADQLFTVNTTRCIGACGLAPILVADGSVHGRIGPGEIKRIIQKNLKGENVENKKH